jgi:hypothetical protein
LSYDGDIRIMANYPTKKQLKHLKRRDWRLGAKGLAWQSPYDKYYYSPAAAVAREVKRESEHHGIER